MTPVTERCALTDLLVDGCAHCLKIPDPPKSAHGPVFTAQYGGRCTNCGAPFDAGQPIRADCDGGYLGPCCADDTPIGEHRGPH